MATVGTFHVALTASTGRFVGGLSQAERRWDKFVRSIQRDAKLLPETIRKATSASLALLRLVVKFGAAGIAITTGLGLVGIKLAANFEQTRIAFTTLLGDVQKANAFLHELVEFSARTPFRFTGVTQAARQLLAYGFAAEEVLPTLTAVGDAVAALGGGQEGIKRAVLALGQMRAKGKLAGEEMRQLTELGIPAWEMLAESIGVSIPEAMKLVEKRAITASQGIAAILAGINRRFAGAMDVQSKTLLGRLSTLRDNIEIILRGMGEDIIRLTDLGRRIDRLTSALSRFAAIVIEKGFVNALREAFPVWLIPIIVTIAGAITGALVPAITLAAVAMTKKLLVSMGLSIAVLWKWALIGAAVALVAYVVAKAWGRLGDIAKAVWMSISAVVLFAASLVVSGVGAILTALSWIIPALSRAARAVHNFAASLRQSAASAWTAAKSGFTGVQQTKAIAKSTENVAKTAQAAAESQEQFGDSIKKAGESAAKNLQSFDEVHTIEEKIASSASGLDVSQLELDVPDIVPSINPINAAVAQMGEQISKVAETASSAWERLKQAMEPVNRAVQWIKDNWPTIGPIVQTIAGLITAFLIPALIKSGIEAMIAAGKHVIAWGMKAGAALIHGAVVIGQLILVGIKWAWLGVQALVNAGKVVLAWGMQGWEAAKSVAIQIAQFVILVAKWAWLGVQALINAGKVVLAWIIQQGPAIAAAATTAASAAIIVGKWIWMATTSTANAVVMAASWFIALGPVAWVIATIALVATVVALNWDFVKTKTIEIWNTVSTWLAEKWNNISEKLTSIWSGIRDIAKQKWESVKDIIRGVLNDIISIINRFIRFWNKIEFKVPSMNLPLIGQVGGWTVGVPKIPEIPMLAKGGIVTAPTLAVIGERGPEVVKPLPRAEQEADAIARAVYAAIIDAMRFVQPEQGEREIVIQLDGTKIARVILPALVREGQRVGMPIISGTVI